MYKCGRMEGGGCSNAGEIAEGVLQAEDESANPRQTWCSWVEYRGLSADVRTYRMWQVCVGDREATEAGPASGVCTQRTLASSWGSYNDHPQL